MSIQYYGARTMTKSFGIENNVFYRKQNLKDIFLKGSIIIETFVFEKVVLTRTEIFGTEKSSTTAILVLI